MITYHPNMVQGSDEWHSARCGLLTASEMRLVLTPTLKIADNDKIRKHVWELAAQRITKYVEPSYVGDAMIRGHEDEITARALYSSNYEQVTETGFCTNDRWGFTLGASPDGLVGLDGMIECKSRIQKYQIQTIVEHYRDGSHPSEYMLQIQTALLVTERKWCDLISYSGGLPLAIMRIEPDAEIQDAIVKAATTFDERVESAVKDYWDAFNSMPKVIETARRDDAIMEIFG